MGPVALWLSDDYSHPMMLRKIILSGLLLGPALLSPAMASPSPMTGDMNAASVYAYFRVGDEEQETPGLSLENFEAHIREIANPDNGYHVMSLPAILKSQTAHETLPPKTIALSFDGTDASFLHNALPLLEKNKIPFTLFVSPGLLDISDKTQSDSLMHWKDIQSLQKDNLATIGMTSYNYSHNAHKNAEDIAADLNAARARYRDMLAAEPIVFSYPFGEYSEGFVSAVSKQGFTAAFGQQSGAIDETTPRLTMPRYTITDDFSDIERFRMTSTSLAFPVKKMQPAGSLVQKNPPDVSFVMTDGLANDISKLSCFATGVGKLSVKKDKDGTAHILFPSAFEDSKGRVNCTLPAAPLDGDDTPRWRWLGFLFSFPETEPANPH